jgi:hypothetical protein
MAKVFSLRRKSTLALRQRKETLLGQVSVHPDLLRASVVERFTTCGKGNCSCRQGQKHGPFYYLTACLAAGRILKYLLKESQEQEQARAGVAHYYQLTEQLEELSQINAELLRRGEPLAHR